MDIIHTAIWVSDVDEAESFFCDALGLTRAWEFDLDGVRNVYVRGDDGTEIQFRHDSDADGDVTPSGIDHLAVGVEDVDAEFERVVEETGCPVVSEPTTVDAADARVAFVEGPDGYVVEFVESLA